MTHDIFEAVILGDRVAILHEGNLEQVGTSKEVYEYPASRFVGDLFSKPSKQLAAFKEIL